MLHRRAGRDPARAEQGLGLLGQVVDQPESSRDPARATTQTTRRLGRSDPLATQFGEQPTLFQSCFRDRRAQSAGQEKRLAVGHFPDHRAHRIHTQAAQRADSLIAVDNSEVTRRRP